MEIWQNVLHTGYDGTLHQEAESKYCVFNFTDQRENSFFTGLYSELVEWHKFRCIFWDASDSCGNILILLTDTGKEKHLVGI